MPDQAKDDMIRAPESGEATDRPHGSKVPSAKDATPADPTPPGQPKVGEDLESGRQTAR